MDGTSIDGIGIEQECKYLGIKQAFKIKEVINRELPKEEFFRRLNTVLRTCLKAKKNISMQSIPVQHLHSRLHLVL